MKRGVLIRRTTSLGRNPRRGGRPPKDKRESAITIFVWGEIELEEDISFGVLIFDEWNRYIKIIKCRAYEEK